MNGLNFKRFYNDGVNINIDQMVELRRQRLDKDDNFVLNDVLIESIASAKVNYKQSRPEIQFNRRMHCSCWQDESFIDSKTESIIESEYNRTINVFNPETMKRFQDFLYDHSQSNHQFHNLTWEEFCTDDRLLDQVTNNYSDEDAGRISEDTKWNNMETAFRSINMETSKSMIQPISTLCKRIISCVCIKLHDLAILYRLVALKATVKRDIKQKTMDTRPTNHPLIYHMQAKNVLDLFLLPLIFKEVNLDAPLFLVNECPYVNKLRFVLSRLGYAIQPRGVAYDSLSDVMFSIKLCKLVQQKKSICIVDVLSSCTRETTDDRLSSRSILSIAKNFLQGIFHDPVFIPMMINHEFVPEIFHFTSNSFWTSNSILSMWTLFKSNHCGIVNFSVLTPIYLSKFDSQTLQNLQDDEDSHQQMFTNTQNLVKHIDVFNDCNLSLMPTHMVAFILLYWYPKNQPFTTVSDVVDAMEMMIAYIIPKELIFFSSASVQTIVLRGVNKLSHLISISDNDEDTILQVDYSDIETCLELDFYADVVIRTIKLKAAAVLTFAFNVEFDPLLQYQTFAQIPLELFESQYTETLQKLLVRFFRYRLTCESLESIVATDLMSWWNETLLSPTKATDDAWQKESRYNTWAKDLNSGDRSTNEVVYAYLSDETRVLPIFSALLRCLGPRLEARLIVNQILIGLSDTSIQSAINTFDVWNEFKQVTEEMAVNGELRFAQTLNQDHFISSLLGFFTCETLQIFDLEVNKERRFVYANDWQYFCSGDYRFSLISFDREALMTDLVYNNQLMTMLHML